MKTYLIKNTDIMFNGKLFPEGSIIKLDDKDAQSLSNYLTEIKDVSKVNSDQKANTKRSK